MLLVPRIGEPLERLANEIRLAAEPSCRLIDDIVAECGRFNVLKRACKAPDFHAWCKSGAWLEAAFALVAGELPNWSVRRLANDSGLWFCALSHSPNMPLEFDDIVETSHENIALAVLLAFVEAKRDVAAPVADARTDGAQGRHRVCCDNFA